MSSSTTMDYRTVGASALKMSAITLGTRSFATEVSEGEAVRLIHRCLDLGITSFDVVDEGQPAGNTNGRQGGRAEAILGRALRGRRDNILIATRGGDTLSPQQNRPRHSRESLRDQVEDSLKRLQTDHLDLFLLHYPDPLTPLAESLEALASLIDQGRIRYYGLSNYTAWQTAEIVWEAEDKGVPLPVLNQVNYNLLRRSQELDLFVVCDQYGLGVAPYSSFQGGLLTGRYQPNSSLKPHHREKMREWLAGMTEDCWQAVDLICRLAEEVGKTPAQYALAWTLAQPGVCSVVLGITEAEHIDEAVAAEAWEIPADHFARIDALTAGKRLLV